MTIITLEQLLKELNLDLAAIALLPERGVLTGFGLWQGAGLLLELALAAVIARGAGPGPVWPPLAYAFLPRALSMWTRLDQPALLAFLLAAGAVVLLAVGSQLLLLRSSLRERPSASLRRDAVQGAPRSLEVVLRD